MNLAVVCIGDELLSGDTLNTNAAWLGARLTERGVTVERTTVVPDRIADIARIVNEYRAEYDAVITTGGLGPTHDDMTMAGVAAAFGRTVETNQEVLEWLDVEGGYQHADLAAGTADLPAGATPIHNTEGVAPGCIIENVYVLPGVPAEMKVMFETIEDDFEGERRHVTEVVVDEPESALLEQFAELQERFDVKVGSYPGESVRVKIESTDEETVVSAAAWLRERVTKKQEET